MDALGLFSIGWRKSSLIAVIHDLQVLLTCLKLDAWAKGFDISVR
ncbi:hypothetical protein ACFL3F_05305 [Planctomycetota bacterium]